MNYREVSFGERGIENKLYYLALKEIGFSGNEEDVLINSKVVGQMILDQMAIDEADSLLVRPKGSGSLPMKVQVNELFVYSNSSAFPQPVDFVARLAALASNGGEAYVKDIELGWARGEEVKFPVFNLSSGKLKSSGRFGEFVNKIRQFGVR